MSESRIPWIKGCVENGSQIIISSIIIVRYKYLYVVGLLTFWTFPTYILCHRVINYGINK